MEEFAGTGSIHERRKNVVRKQTCSFSTFNEASMLSVQPLKSFARRTEETTEHKNLMALADIYLHCSEWNKRNGNLIFFVEELGIHVVDLFLSYIFNWIVSVGEPWKGIAECAADRLYLYSMAGASGD